MSITEETARRVDSALDRLCRRDDTFEVVRKEWVVSPSWYAFTRERVEDGALGGAGAWIVGPDGQVLLVRRRGEDRWEEPGGKHEPDESLERTAVREAREEAGVECDILGVAQVHRITVACEQPTGRPALEQLFVIFRADHAGGEPRADGNEIEAVRWWDHHPEAVHYEEIRDIPIPAAE